MKLNIIVSSVLLFLFVPVSISQNQEATADVPVAKIGKSSIKTDFGKIPVRIVISSYQIDIGKQ